MINIEEHIEKFEKIIGYSFSDKGLIEEALSHSSYANEKKKTRHSNERLEFLGDSVLSIVVSQYLFEHYTHLPEGELTKIRASLVCEKSLHEFAKTWEILFFWERAKKIREDVKDLLFSQMPLKL